MAPPDALAPAVPLERRLVLLAVVGLGRLRRRHDLYVVLRGSLGMLPVAVGPDGMEVDLGVRPAFRFAYLDREQP